MRLQFVYWQKSPLLSLYDILLPIYGLESFIQISLCDFHLLARKKLTTKDSLISIVQLGVIKSTTKEQYWLLI